MGRSTINEITLWDRHNYASFSDTDLRNDCVNGYCLGVKQTIAWVKRDGGERIVIRFGNGVDCQRYRKRLASICSRCGYSCEERREEVSGFGSDGWVDFWFVLTMRKTLGEIEVDAAEDATAIAEGLTL